MDATTRIEDQADGRFAFCGAQHVPGTQSLDLDRWIRLDALDRRVRPVVWRVEVRHRQFQTEPGDEEDRHDDQNETPPPASAEKFSAPGQPPDHHARSFGGSV
jgi:hypothetical protein